MPKFTVVVGGSFGAGNYGMCGRAYSPRFMWMWPNAKIAVMGGEQAAGVLTQVRDAGAAKAGKPNSAEASAEYFESIRAKYELESEAYFASARVWDDGIIDPADTRRVVGMALAACGQAPLEPVSRGIFRM